MSKITYKDGKHIEKNQSAPTKRMGWRYFLMWFSGFISAGLVVGIVAIVLSSSFSAKEILTLFGRDPNELLQPYYQDMSIIRMITDLSQKKFETLGDIYVVTPMAKTLFDDYINPVLEKELHYEYTWEEVSIKPFKTPVEPRADGSIDPNEDLSTYLGRSIKEGVYLANFISGDTPSLLNLFLYPKTELGEFDFDNPYSLMDYISADSDFFDNIIDSIKVKDLTGETGIPLIDNEDGIGNWGLNDFTNENIDNIKLSLFLDNSSTTPLIRTLIDDNWVVGDLKDDSKIKGLKLEDVITINDSSPKLLQTLKELGYTIATLESTNLYNVLTIEDVFDTEGNRFLTAIEGFYLSDLEDENAILGLYLGDVLPGSESGDSIIDKFADKTLSELSSLDIHDIKLSDIFSNSEIASNKIINRLVTVDPDITIGDLSDSSVIQSLYLSDILSDEQIASNNLISQLSIYTIAQIPNQINSLPLGPMLGIDKTDPDTSQLLKSIADETISSLPNFIDNITLGDVMDFTSYPNLDNDDVKGTRINDFDDIIYQLKNHLKLKDVVDIDSSSPWILQRLQNEYLFDLGNQISTFTLGDFVEIDSSSPLVLQNLASSSLDDLETDMRALTLSQIVPISPTSPQIIKSLADVTVLDGTSLVDKFNTLKLNEIYTEAECTGLFKHIWDNTSGGDVLLSDIPDAVNDLPLVTVLEDEIYINDVTKAKYYDEVTDTYYSYSELVDGKSPDGNPVIEYKKIDPVWWLLFTELDETFSPDEKYYVLKNGLSYTVGSGMDDIVTNFSNHMRVESIQALYEAGLIEIAPENLMYLNNYVLYKGSLKRVGDMTMSEFLDFCLANISV